MKKMTGAKKLAICIYTSLFLFTGLAFYTRFKIVFIIELAVTSFLLSIFIIIIYISERISNRKYFLDFYQSYQLALNLKKDQQLAAIEGNLQQEIQILGDAYKNINIAVIQYGIELIEIGSVFGDFYYKEGILECIKKLEQ